MKDIAYEEVFYQRNLDLGLAPYCYECTSHCMTTTGYPMLQRDGFIRMHRWLWWKETGELPEVVMHLCDNRKCINVAHLKAGTVKDNQQDMAAKGRTRGGAPCGNKLAAKLSEPQVRAAREMRKEGKTHQEIAEELFVSRHVVGYLLRGQTYTTIK